MLNRFSAAVQTAVSGAVQGMLGEEFSKSYETPRDCTASGGHELAWRIFPAISRKTNQEVSVFVFDKDDLKKIKNKDAQERYLDVLRQEMKTLRLLRHPHVLKVEEIFEESRRTLSFVTERVTCSLANACKNFTNVANVTPEVLEIGLSEFELACGLIHVGEALSFLHREGRRVHLSLGPHSVFITPKGEWKLGGMGFCRVVEPGKTSRSEYYGMDSQPSGSKNATSGLWEGSFEPPLQYCAPELVTEPRLFNSQADMFSLGLLVMELFLAPRADGGRNPVLDVRDGNKMTHGYKVQSLHPIRFPPTVPVSLHTTITSLLSLTPSQRPEPRSFLASQFFDSGPIKTLRTLQSLVEQDPASQAKFLTTLPQQIDGFSTRTLRDMVLPGLQAVAMNKQVQPFVITPLLKIVAKVDKLTFNHAIAPMMIGLLTITEPVQCMLMFVSELEVLIPKAEDAYIRDHIVPMLCRSLDSTVPEILDTVLNKIKDQASLFEYRILKQVILPRVNKLILQPPQASVRVNALLWLGKSFNVFDKDLLVESVLPTLAQCIQVDKTPAVCMCVLGCYDNLGKHLGPEFIAKLILPAVVPLLWEQSLNGAQFDAVCEKINDMVKTVISERDKMFEAENSVKSITTNVTVASGMSEAIQAAEKSKEQRSGVAAAHAMLQEEYVPQQVEEKRDDKPKSPGPYRDDPFYLGSRSTSAASSGSSGSGHHERRDEHRGARGGEHHTESYASRRRAKKRGAKKTGSSTHDDSDKQANLLDLPSNSQTSSSATSDLLSTSSLMSSLPTTAPVAPPINASSTSNMFSGMNIAGPGAPNAMNQPSAHNAMTPYNLNMNMQQPQQPAMGMTMGMNPNPMNNTMGMNNMNMNMGMGMQQQQYAAPQQQQQQFQYNQQQNMGYPNGPGQRLQIQAGQDQYPPPQAGQMGGDKFSAFDGL